MGEEIIRGEPNINDGKEYVASISYGKDSLAMLHVITDVLGWPLHRIITTDVWATDTIPADLPPMVEFKNKADKIIKERWGIEVEHLCAKKTGHKKWTYQDEFYTVRKTGQHPGEIVGWPFQNRAWCNGTLKMRPVRAFIHQWKARWFHTSG